MQRVAETHALDNLWRDPFGICHRFVGRHIVSQIVFVDTSERPQKRAQTCARSFTADQTQDGWPVVRIAALAFPFIGAPARRVGHVAIGRTFFLLRSDTAHQPRTPFQSSVRPGG